MTEPAFAFTIPPTVCLFGEREHVARIYTASWQTTANFVEATVLLAAESAALAIAGRSKEVRGWMTCELGTPEHQAARASIHAYLMASSPDVVSNALWRAVEDEQRRAFRSHYMEMSHQRRLADPSSPPFDATKFSRFSLPRVSGHQPSECQDPASVRVASIVAYLHRVAEQQDGYAKNSEGARWHPGERPEGGYVYTKRLRERAFMARALAKRIARGDDLLTGPGACP